MRRNKEGDLKTIEIKADRSVVFTVLFADDGKQILSGGSDGALRRWTVDDGHEVGEPIRTEEATIWTAALSPNGKWLAQGFSTSRSEKAGVWDAESQEKVLGVQGLAHSVICVDVSVDSKRLATGTQLQGDCAEATIWCLTTGKKLIGPLRHDSNVMAVRFSPIGDRIATATIAGDPIRIYNSENGGLLLTITGPSFTGWISCPLAWSADERQLFAASCSKVKVFDTSSGSLLSEWSAPGGGENVSIVLSRSQRFAVVVAFDSLSFWDIQAGKQIGDAIRHTTRVNALALSDRHCVAVGEYDGTVTLYNLCDILPVMYLTGYVQLPLMDISPAVFDSWTEGNLTRAEEILTREMANPSQHARALAQRALVRYRMKKSDMAVSDAKKSIEVKPSAVGYIANAVTLLRSEEHESALDKFDLGFTICPPSDNTLVFLIKAAILFESGKHDNAIARIDGLIDLVDDKPLYITFRAKMFFQLGAILLEKGNFERATELLARARDATPFQAGPPLEVISLIFGWDFGDLDVAIRLKLRECIQPIEDLGDTAVQSKNPEEAMRHYSTALSLDPAGPAELHVKRSKVHGMLKSWTEALKDADEAIKADSASPWGYEARHAALHALERYDESLDAFTHMFSLIEGSTDQDIRRLGKKYVPPSRLAGVIDNVIRGVLQISPLVLIDVKNGCLCDGPKQSLTFKSEPEFKGLVSSITERVDDNRIQRVVEGYFRYITLSHVWEGREPSFQDVNEASSIWELESSSPLNEKLQKFCEQVRKDGYRWAWSDTCCIDKTVSTVLNQSLKMMYRWYEASVATFVFLRDVESLSAVVCLKDSIWLTRAWTSQELLSPKVVRFYTCDWKPYLGDTRLNHKESPEIMQELASAIGIARETIITFNPDDLGVREKLRLASNRRATVEEDMAYSLIGIFKSDIRPEYGEGYAALGHLLEEIVARSGEVTVLDWTGTSSPYNSCLPTSLAVYSRLPCASPTIDNAEMDARVGELRDSLSRTQAIQVHDQITSLPPARFANRRLYLPCIIFAVRRLGVQNLGRDQEFRYRARISGIGQVDFQTFDKLSPSEPRKLIFVHPWLRDLRDPLDGFAWGGAVDEDEDDGEFMFGPEDGDGSVPSSPLHATPAAMMDEYTRALRLIVRLQQPFHALVLQQQPNGEFKRVAAEHEIVVPGIQRGINFAKDVRTAAVEIL